MNILLTRSSVDGPSFVAFNLESLKLNLEYHKNIYDVISFLIKNKGDKKITKKFGKDIEIIHGELTDNFYFIENVLRGEAEFADEESEEYNPDYIDITIQPPFHIDEVFTLKTFV